MAHESHDGPLPKLLLVLTFVTGVVDATSYLNLGHVFVGNMTGNVVFLGFAIGGAEGFSISAPVVALVAFLVGALGGGLICNGIGRHRGRMIAAALLTMAALSGVSLIIALFAARAESRASTYALIVLLALAMGLQNAVSRRLGVPGMTTNVLTSTLTGIASDSARAGNHPHRGRGLVAALTMLAGAAVGAYVVLNAGLSAALALTFLLLAANAIAACRAASSKAEWTLGT